jgi:hypothetical protein
MPEAGLTVYNPYSESHVNRVWGKVQEAEPAAQFSARTGIKLENISNGLRLLVHAHVSCIAMTDSVPVRRLMHCSDDLIIWLAPGETILGHTMEFLGGRKTVTTMMKARSSVRIPRLINQPARQSALAEVVVVPDGS